MSTQTPTATSNSSLSSPADCPSAIAIFGHKNPDTDAIVSAIATGEWLNQLNIPAIPFRLGELNKETQYLLNLTPHIPVPTLLENLPKDTAVALVDHNESQQSIANLAELTLAYVIDHHRLGDLQTSEPAFIHFRAFGSCATIIFTLMKQDNCLISPELAVLMAGAIVSDTLNLTSPTTTETDRHALSELAKTANIEDISAFANDLFTAKSDVSDLTDSQLITNDYKQFSFGKGNRVKKWGIAVIETVNPSQIFERIATLKTAMSELCQQDNLDYLLVIVVDILQQHSWAIATDTTQNTIIEQAFSSQLDDNKIPLGNRVSRKKQFVPVLESFYSR